jgi:hypothetical protein
MSEAQEDGVIIEEVPKEANSLKRCHVCRWKPSENFKLIQSI